MAQKRIALSVARFSLFAFRLSFFCCWKFEVIDCANWAHSHTFLSQHDAHILTQKPGNWMVAWRLKAATGFQMIPRLKWSLFRSPTAWNRCRFSPQGFIAFRDLERIVCSTHRAIFILAKCVGVARDAFFFFRYFELAFQQLSLFWKEAESPRCAQWSLAPRRKRLPGLCS